MDYDELPDDWDAHSLDDPELLGGVVDLLTRQSDCLRGTLLVLLADEQLRLLQPIAIDDMPIGCSATEQYETMRAVVEMVAHVCPGGGVAAAVARGGHPVSTGWDQHWREALATACRHHRMTDLGCYLATPHGVVRLADDRCAA